MTQPLVLWKKSIPGEKASVEFGVTDSENLSKHDLCCWLICWWIPGAKLLSCFLLFPSEENKKFGHIYTAYESHLGNNSRMYGQKSSDSKEMAIKHEQQITDVAMRQVPEGHSTHSPGSTCPDIARKGEREREGKKQREIGSEHIAFKSRIFFSLSLIGQTLKEGFMFI